MHAIRRFIEPLVRTAHTVERWVRTEPIAGEAVPWRTRSIVALWLWVHELMEAELTTRAAAIAYVLVFSLIPLVTTSLAFLTAFPALADERAALTQALFDQLLPGAVHSVRNYIEDFAARATATGAVSSLVFFVLVLMLLHTVEQAFNRVWRAPRPRSWTERIKILALALVVGSIAGAATVAAGAQLEQLATDERLRGVLDERTALARTALQVGNIFIAWTVFTLANKVLPNARVRWGAAIVGGVVAGSAWHVLKSVFTWYVLDIASYQTIYGALGVVPAFFLWVYLTMIVLLAGACLTFVLQNGPTLASARRRNGREEPQIAFHAVATLVALAQSFERGEPPQSARGLAERLKLPLYLVAQALEPLACGGAVLAVGTGPEARYALAKPASSMRVMDVVTLASGEDLELPQDRPAHPVLDAVAAVFTQARQEQGGALGSATVETLARGATESERSDGDVAPKPTR